MREGRAGAAGLGADERDVESEVGAQRHQPHRWDQRVRKERSVASGFGAAERDVGGGGGTGADFISFNAGISLWEKDEQWQRALLVLLNGEAGVWRHYSLPWSSMLEDEAAAQTAGKNAENADDRSSMVHRADSKA